MLGVLVRLCARIPLPLIVMLAVVCVTAYVILLVAWGRTLFG
jgi:hypothetical protein